MRKHVVWSCDVETSLCWLLQMSGGAVGGLEPNMPD